MANLQFAKYILCRSSGEGLHHPLLYAAQGVRYRKLEVILTAVESKKLYHRRKGNELRHPVTKEEILAEVARQLQVLIEPENLQLPTPSSSLGEYEVPIHLPKSIPTQQGKVQWTLSVKIRKW